MRRYLGVRVRHHLNAIALQLLTQRCEILNDAVVNNRRLAVERDVRVRILIGRTPMSSPTGMTNGGGAGHRAWPHLSDLVLKILQLAGTLSHVKAIVAEDGDAGGVVSAVLHSSQSFQRNAERLLLTYVSHDSTHADHINL